MKNPMEYSPRLSAARGLPKAKVMLGDLLKALEARGYAVDFSGSVTKVSALTR